MKASLPHSTIAKAIGCSRQHVTALVRKGMRTDSIDAALGWYRYNVQARKPRLWLKPSPVTRVATSDTALDFDEPVDFNDAVETMLSSLTYYDDKGEEINTLLFDPGVEFAATWEEVERTPPPIDATTGEGADLHEGGQVADKELTTEEMLSVLQVMRHDAAQRVYGLPSRLDEMIGGRVDGQTRALVRVATEVLRDRFFDAQGYPPTFIPWEERKAGEVVEFSSPLAPDVVTRRVVPVRRRRE